jgi:hypothetical protein
LWNGIFIWIVVRSDWCDIKLVNILWKSEKVLFCSEFFYLNSNKKLLMWRKKCKKVRMFLIWFFWEKWNGNWKFYIWLPNSSNIGGHWGYCMTIFSFPISDHQFVNLRNTEFIWQNFLEDAFCFFVWKCFLIWYIGESSFELFVNVFALLVESKKLGQKALPNGHYLLIHPFSE